MLLSRWLTCLFFARNDDLPPGLTSSSLPVERPFFKACKKTDWSLEVGKRVAASSSSTTCTTTKGGERESKGEMFLHSGKQTFVLSGEEQAKWPYMGSTVVPHGTWNFKGEVRGSSQVK